MSFVIRQSCHDNDTSWFEYYVSGSYLCSSWNRDPWNAFLFETEDAAQEVLNKLSGSRGEIAPLSPDIRVGDIVWIRILPFSNTGRRINSDPTNDEAWLCKGEVLAVGRKYITVKNFGSNRILKFNIDNFAEAGDDCDHILFRTHYAAYQSVRTERLWRGIRGAISNQKFSPVSPLPFHIQDIEKIAKILHVDID